MYFKQLNVIPFGRHFFVTILLSAVLPSAMAQSAKKTVLAPSHSPAAVASDATAPDILAHGPAGTFITTQDLLGELSRAPEESRKAIVSNPDSVQQLVSNLLVRRALAKEAEHEGLAKNPIVAAIVAVAQDRVLSDAQLVHMDKQNAPSDAALEAYAKNLYDANLAKFDVPEQTRASHILLANTGPESLLKAKALVAELRAGANFEEMAKAQSTDTGSGLRGGDLGFFGPGKMVKPFEDAVKALAKPGDLSEPIESQFGYHIIRLDERHEKHRKPFEEVKPQLLTEARTAILNEARVNKVVGMAKDFRFDTAAIEAFSKAAAP